MKRSSVRAISIFLFILLMSYYLISSTAITSALATEASFQTASTVGSFNSSTLSIDPAGGRIRVAQIDLSNFYDYDRHGPIGGYGFEYLEEISNYTGWEYDYVPVTWERGLEMLESGEIDLLAPAPAFAELEKRFDYSDHEIGLNYAVLCVAVEDSDTALNDFSAINGMRVGMLEGYSAAKNLEEYQEENDFQVTIMPFENQAALLKALHDDKIDAILTSSLEIRPTERVIAKFSPEPYYFITAEGRSEIMKPLNDALSSIKENNPYYDYELQEKYYNWDQYTIPIFTKEEKEYIRNAEVLKTVYDPVWAPIEYYDEETGEFSGIDADIFKLISNMTGLRFSYIKTDSYTEALSMITNYEADLLTGIDNDIHWANQHNLVLTDAFLSASIVLVKNREAHDLEHATAALAKDYLAATEYVKKSSPDAKIKYYDTPLDCFRAVNKGEADITYANSYVAEKLLEDPRLNKLSIVETVNLADHLCIGISDAADPILLSILNKSIHSISDTQLNRIIFDHTINEMPVITLEYLLYKNPNYLFMIMIAIFLIITAVMVIVILSKNHHNKEIKKVAYLDSVTGTWNYNKFKVDALNLLKNVKSKDYAIVYLDIYKFSYLNDTFGYHAGDIILTEVAKVLQSGMRETECSARLSADNFVCLMEYESDEAVIERGRAFRKKCDERLSQVNSRFKVYFTTAIYKVPQGQTDIPSLVGKADIAHKTINDTRKSSIVFYNDKIQNDYLKKKKLEDSMSSSLEQGDFLVYLQPKVDLKSRYIVGTEALTRWQHPTEGLIMPNHFISLFESNGFILELDFYVYEEVCRLLRKWLDAEEAVMPVSVNVSRAHLTNPQFSSHLRALVDRYQIEPRLLELELTESILLGDTQEAVSMIRDLKDCGFSILIDDFGSGYSSLNLLKDLTLTVDVLKLDKEFFRRAGMTEKDKIIVEGIIRIARELNLKILSEGIETSEQAEFLLSSGCHMAQGYYFAMPMPVGEFEKLVGYDANSKGAIN